MRRQLVTAVLAMLVFTVLLGLVYPLVVTGISQVAFNHAANGSEITQDGKVVGSELIGADYSRPVLGADGKPKKDSDGDPVTEPDPKEFQSRPSVSGNSATATYFANRGPNQVATRDLTKAHLDAYLALEKPYDTALVAGDVPVDAVTFSASGVDPHISQANARIQAHRIAAVRRLPLARVNQLIADNTDGRFLGVFGEPGVNVAVLNHVLDQETR
jgi:potassium-transporting ATPase KdpC subunit